MYLTEECDDDGYYNDGGNLVMKLIFYTIDGCPKCFLARKHLLKNNIDFQEVNILHENHAAKVIKERIGEVIVPVLVGKHNIWRELEILNIKK